MKTMLIYLRKYLKVGHQLIWTPFFENSQIFLIFQVNSNSTHRTGMKLAIQQKTLSKT
jgi:hypothetical protein